MLRRLLFGTLGIALCSSVSSASSCVSSAVCALASGGFYYCNDSPPKPDFYCMYNGPTEPCYTTRSRCPAVVDVSINERELKEGNATDVPPKTGPPINLFQIDDSSWPARIETAKFLTSSSKAMSGEVLNNSPKRIVAYTIGWAAIEQDMQSVDIGPVNKGNPTPIKQIISAGERAQIPTVAIPARLWVGSEHPPLAIGFYIAKVEFADGTTWSPDMSEVLKNLFSTGIGEGTT